MHPPILVTSFPKSGTHLITKFLHPLARPCQRFIRFIPEPPYYIRRVFATHQENSWSADWRPTEEVLEDVSIMYEGEYAGGHWAYMKEVADYFNGRNVGLIFLYRDFRDIVVSTAYHVAGYKNMVDMPLYHPGHDDYMELPTHEDRMRAIILGHGRWPSLIEKWEQWAGWLDEEWVLPMTYAKIRLEPKEAAIEILRYLNNRMDYPYTESMVNAMVENANNESSITFRKGKVGGWKDEFGPSLTALAERELGPWMDRLNSNGRSR